MEFIQVEDDPNEKGSKDDALSPREKRRVDKLYDEISKSNFDPKTSSMLIFSSTRRQVEEIKNELVKKFSNSNEERLKILADCIECFHGGMTTTERDDIYRKFKGKDEESGDGDEREFSILVATKAFGMGMNIPDIHYIYHAFPPDNLEDYLQEIGRAGRNLKKIPQGYGSRKNGLTPLSTQCFVSDEDIKHSKELLSGNSLKWDEVREVYKVVTAYIKLFPENAFVSVPANIWKRRTRYGIKDDPTAFRIALHWLEELQRIETRFSTTAAYDFSIGLNSNQEVKDEVLKQILSYTIGDTCPNDLNGRIQVSIADLRKYCKITQTTLDDKILECQKHLLLNLKNTTSFYFSNRFKKHYLADIILKDTKPEEFSIPFSVCSSIVEQLFSSNILNKEVRIRCISDILENTDFNQRNNTKEAAKTNEISRLERIAFKLIELLPGVKSLKNDSKDGMWSVIISPNVGEVVKNQLSELEERAWKLLTYLTKKSFEQAVEENEQETNEKPLKPKEVLPSIIWTDAAIELGFNCFADIDSAAEAIKILGLANIDSFLPTGIEVRLTDDRDELIPPTTDQAAIDKHKDAEIYKRFKEIDDIRQLKLVNLISLAKIKDSDSEPRWKRFDEAIKDYFECETKDSFIAWTNNIVNKEWLSPEDKQTVNELLSQYREEAFNTQIKGLNDEQKKVCNYDKDKDLIVLAGPGSGKTHVLTLRCAKLLNVDKVNREDILVLAYNRGVVNELKSRLQDLFLKLGYTKMMSRIKVMTFHSFVKIMDTFVRERRDKINNAEGAEGFLQDSTQDWEKDFITYLSNDENQNEIISVLQAKSFRSAYFMIDEFQDVTQERLDILFEMKNLLSKIGRPAPKFFVIGDINQSIYGYQRTVKDNNGNSLWFKADGSPISISPEPLYKQLRDRLGVKEEDDLKMGISYRSYQKILAKAEYILKTCTSYKDFELKSDPEMEQREDCVFEFDSADQSWDKDFSCIIKDLKERNLKQAAFLFRTNAELYAAYTQLRTLLNQGPVLANTKLKVQIQGNSEQFFRTRECYLAIHYLFEKTPTDIVTKEKFKNFLEYIGKEKQFQYLDKDAIDLTYAIALSCYDNMPKEPTYKEMADEMLEIAYESVNDLLKIKERYKDRIPDLEKRDDNEIEIIFSVMHRVKGLEFDAVIINPSENNIGYENNQELPKHALCDALDEERRLLYVACTRAKNYLRIYSGPREKQLLARNEAYHSAEEGNQTTVRIESGLDKYNKSYGLTHEILTTMPKDTPVMIEKDNYGHGIVKLGGQKIGMIYSQYLPREWGKITGLYLNDFIVWRYEDALNNDNKYGYNNANKWPEDKRKPHKYVLVPDVSGVGIIEK